MKVIAPPTRLLGLDTLRAFAVLIVMLYHLTIFEELPGRILPVTYFGWIGVDLFFVLSGFLIGQQALKPYLTGQRLSILDFYSRRAYRILPAYLVVVALYFLVPAWREAPLLAPLWKFLTFTSNFGFTFDRRAFSHAWSLCVEEHFYFILPLLVVGMMRRPSARRTVALIASVLVGGIVLRALLVHQYPDEIYTRVYYPSYTRLDGLVIGVCLALIRTFRPTWWQAIIRHGHYLVVASILFTLGLSDVAAVRVNELKVFPVKSERVRAIDDVIAQVQTMMAGAQPLWMRRAISRLTGAQLQEQTAY